jgi:hypothetical protein
MIKSRFETWPINCQFTMPPQPVCVESSLSLSITSESGRFNKDAPPARIMPFLIQSYARCPSKVRVLS